MAFELPDINLPTTIPGGILDNLQDIGLGALGDAIGIKNRPIDALKANTTSWLKTAKFRVLVLPPPGISAGSSILTVIGNACYSAEGMGAQSFNTTDIRRGEANLRRVPNDLIYPDLSLGFYNVLQRDTLVVYKFFAEWMSLVHVAGTGFGFPEDYTGALEITQLGEDGQDVHTHFIDNFYPSAVAVGGLQAGSSDELHTVEVRGVQYPSVNKRALEGTGSGTVAPPNIDGWTGAS
jgi:hypothetical protein